MTNLLHLDLIISQLLVYSLYVCRYFCHYLKNNVFITRYVAEYARFRSQLWRADAADRHFKKNYYVGANRPILGRDTSVGKS